MGNRAVIQFGKSEDAMGIYLHWNGGEESVRAFLDAAKVLEVRANDESYKVARLCQIIGNFFGGTLSVGVDLAKNLDQDNGDNGTFIVEGLDIVARKHSGDNSPMDQKRYADILANVLEKNKPLMQEA